jgi:REP element-mobilizing transposase RayT
MIIHRLARTLVTVCVQHHRCLFGEVVDGELSRNAAGQMVAYWWQQLPHKFEDMRLDACVVMPNHCHGIIVLQRDESTTAQTALPDVMHWFKTMTTNAYIRGVKNDGWSRFDGKLWQRSYHDHIVRSADDLTRIRAYIANNPAQWATDRFYQDS